MKKFLLILAIVSASSAFAEECLASYNKLKFYGVFFKSNEGDYGHPTTSDTGTIDCNYTNSDGDYANYKENGQYTIDQPGNFGPGPGMYTCVSNDPVNCQYFSTQQ